MHHQVTHKSCWEEWVIHGKCQIRASVTRPSVGDTVVPMQITFTKEEYPIPHWCFCSEDSHIPSFSRSLCLTDWSSFAWNITAPRPINDWWGISKADPLACHKFMLQSITIGTQTKTRLDLKHSLLGSFLCSPSVFYSFLLYTTSFINDFYKNPHFRHFPKYYPTGNFTNCCQCHFLKNKNMLHILSIWLCKMLTPKKYF